MKKDMELSLESKWEIFEETLNMRQMSNPSLAWKISMISK